MRPLTEDRTQSTACCLMDVNETKQSSLSEAEKTGAADIMHKRLLDQMEWLCRAVQDMENRMEGKIEQHNDITMKTPLQNDLRLEMPLESMWIVCAHESQT